MKKEKITVYFNYFYIWGVFLAAGFFVNLRFCLYFNAMDMMMLDTTWILNSISVLLVHCQDLIRKLFQSFFKIRLTENNKFQQGLCSQNYKIPALGARILMCRSWSTPVCMGNQVVQTYLDFVHNILSKVTGLTHGDIYILLESYSIFSMTW